MGARTKPTNLPRRKLDEARERDSGRQVVVRHRMVDSIGKMMHAGTITPAMHDAARSFQTDFALAGLDPLRARPMTLPCGARCAPEIIGRHIDARRRVHEALDALGGINSPAGSCVWHVVGCGCSIREWAIRRGWSGQPLRQEQAAGILIAALGVLAMPDAIEPKVWRPKADWAKRGEMTRICLDTLRRASAPLCNRDIALALMTARGMDTDDERLVKLIAKRVGCSLHGQRELGRVTSEDGPGPTVVWRLNLT